MKMKNCGANNAAFCKDHPGVCETCRRVSTERIAKEKKKKIRVQWHNLWTNQ